jgi:O-antigen ligase
MTAWPMLIAAAATYVVLPAGWVQIALALVAFLLFASDRRCGIFGGSILILLALPYDRAANTGLLRIADIPVRPHDVVVGAALVLAVANFRSIRWTRGVIALLGFLAIGVLAFLIGMSSDNALRDVLRDARWWFLYAVGLLAVGHRFVRAQVLRGVIVGATVFAVVVVLTALLPTIEGSLKDRALTYDRDTLRMQFGNSVFLMIAACYVAARWLERQSWSSFGWLVLLVGAITLSLTRTLVAVSLVALTLTAVWWLVRRARRDDFSARRIVGAAPLVASIVAGFALGIAVNVGASAIEALLVPDVTTTPTAPGAVAEDPIDRFLFQGDRSGTEPIVTGRMATYVEALNRIQASPVIGNGLGTLVDINYTFGGEEFDTPGKLPNVDDAYLTVGLKAGGIGIAAFAIVLLVPLIGWAVGRRNRSYRWFVPAWLGVIVLTVTQSFATTGYSPFVLSLLVVTAGGLGYASRSTRAAASHA